MKFIKKPKIAFRQGDIKHLNTELNPICHLVILAHHVLHISRIRVNVRTRDTEMYTD